MPTKKKSATKRSTTKKPAKTSTVKKSSGKKSAVKKPAPRPSATKRWPLNITTEGLPPFILGQFNQTRIEADGGTPPYTWSVDEAGGPLPTGINFNSQGTLSGTPVQAGETPIFIRVTDLIGDHQTQAFELYVEPA